MASIFLLKNITPLEDYDYFSEAVVIANTMEEAILMHPNNTDIWENDSFSDNTQLSTWNVPKKIKITCIGVASGNMKNGVVSACFRAG
jgi:hypothetical protein